MKDECTISVILNEYKNKSRANLFCLKNLLFESTLIVKIFTKAYILILFICM